MIDNTISPFSALLERAKPRMLLVDVWGVIFDGRSLLPEAISALSAAHRRGIEIALVSNTSRRSAQLCELLEGLGCPNKLLRRIYTAGEMAFDAVRPNGVTWPLGCRCFVVGRQPGGDWVDEAGLVRVMSASQADFALGIGLLDPSDELTIGETLQECARAGLCLLISNPDLYVSVGPQTVRAVGALELPYKALGGKVLSFGKPDPNMMIAALSEKGCDPADALVLGDGLETDGVAALRAGIRFVLIGDGGGNDQCARTVAAYSTLRRLA